MNYEEALNKVENFMKKSEIRNFCTNVCQGFCCGDCYNTKNACHRNEGRRLSCSAFLCGNLRDLILNPDENDKYIAMQHEIEIKLYKIVDTSKSIYFYPHSREVRDKFSIEDKFLDVLDRINTEDIRIKLRSVSNLHTNSSRFLVKKLSECKGR